MVENLLDDLETNPQLAQELAEEWSEVETDMEHYPLRNVIQGAFIRGYVLATHQITTRDVEPYETTKECRLYEELGHRIAENAGM